MVLWPWLAAGAVLVGGAVLYRLSKEQAAPAASTDACDALARVGPEAVAACKAARALWDKVDLKSTDEKNQALNGPPVYKGDPAMVAGVSASSRYRPVRDFAPDLEYANGGVPVEGHPAWSKCAPGTISIIGGPDVDAFWRNMAPAGYSRAGLLSGDPARDLFTYQWTPARKAQAERVLQRTVNFPLPVPAGAQAWWHKGRPIVCAAGSTINTGRDHRTNAPICAPPTQVVTPPPIIGPDGRPISQGGSWTSSWRQDPIR